MCATLPPVPDRDYDSLIKQVIHRINSAASLPSAPASKTAASSMHTTIAKALETSAAPPMQQRQTASTQVSSTHASVSTSAPPSETRSGGQKSSVSSASTTSSRPPPRSDTSGIPGPLKRSQRSQAETVSVERVRTNGSVEMEQRELEVSSLGKHRNVSFLSHYRCTRTVFCQTKSSWRKQGNWVCVTRETARRCTRKYCMMYDLVSRFGCMLRPS